MSEHHSQNEHRSNMGTKERKEREKIFRRRQIQQCAKQIFLEKGFRASTMAAIARKAELSIGTIYKYFNSKDELYVSMNLESLQHTINEIQNIYEDNGSSPREKIWGIKESLYNRFVSDPLLLKVIFHVQLEGILPALNKRLLKQVNETGQKLMRLISLVYEEGVTARNFREGRGSAHADVIWGTFAGLMIWEEAKSRIDPKKDFLKSTLDLAFDIFCRGIEIENKFCPPSRKR